MRKLKGRKKVVRKLKERIKDVRKWKGGKLREIKREIKWERGLRKVERNNFHARGREEKRREGKRREGKRREGGGDRGMVRTDKE